MKTLLFEGFGAWSAMLWVRYGVPWITRRLGIPSELKFWKQDEPQQRLTRLQFVLVYGVLIFGVGGFLWSTPDELRRLPFAQGWMVTVSSVSFSLAIPVFMGVIIACYCAPMLGNESPVTELGLSKKS